jgi:hypothetical protein
VITKVEHLNFTLGIGIRTVSQSILFGTKDYYVEPDGLQVFWVARGLFSFLNWQAGSVERTLERAAPTQERTAACDSLAKILKGTLLTLPYNILTEQLCLIEKFSFRGNEGQDY